MRSVEVGEDRLLRVVERPEPRAGAGQVVVEVAYCGICGSDLHFRDVPALFPAGTVPGHEFSGSIAALGGGVSGWRTGDRVCVLPFAQCGDCAACRDGNEHVCPAAIAHGVGLGTGRPGAYAERVLVDARMLFALPDALGDQAGTLVEPAAVAVHAVARARPEKQDVLAVIGAGPIGLLTALVAADRGAEVVVISRNPARARRAVSLDLATLSPEEASVRAARHPFDAVLECAGTGSAVALALELVAPLGRVVLVGVAPEPFSFDSLPVIFKEVEIGGSFTYRRADFDAAIELLATRRIPGAELIDDAVGLESAEAAFRSLTAAGNASVKVVLEPAKTR